MVIGGGIVGAALAAYLAEHGRRDVTVLERGPRDRLLVPPVTRRASWGCWGETPVAPDDWVQASYQSA
jgi:glycine/D-amino acid oxidase-like deaminating enzyme